MSEEMKVNWFTDGIRLFRRTWEGDCFSENEVIKIEDAVRSLNKLENTRAPEAEVSILKQDIAELQNDLKWQKSRRNEELHVIGAVCKERDDALSDRLKWWQNAQALQVERDDARAEIDRLKNKNNTLTIDHLNMITERDDALAELQRLTDELNANNCDKVGESVI